MKSDGKQLESLVAFVEGLLLPPGFEVRPNVRLYAEDGAQTAELDIEIRGKVGTTDFAWLFECRDRPSSGAAPVAWIEQLATRQRRLRFNKVTAVSTSGFSLGARNVALSEGVELREVRQLDPSEFSSWLKLSKMEILHKVRNLHHVSVFFNKDESEEMKAEGMEILRQASGKDMGESVALTVIGTEHSINLREAFDSAILHAGLSFDDIPSGGIKPIQINIDDLDVGEYRLGMKTDKGLVLVRKLEFSGSLSLVEEVVPIAKTTEYLHVQTNEAISQTAAFEPRTILGESYEVELHRIAESGETYISVRRLGS